MRPLMGSRCCAPPALYVKPRRISVQGTDLKWCWGSAQQLEAPEDACRSAPARLNMVADYRVWKTRTLLRTSCDLTAWSYPTTQSLLSSDLILH